MAIVLDGTNGITQADQFNSDSTFGFKNRFINGAMVISQAAGGASVTANGSYPVDRFHYQNDSDATVTLQQSSTVPVGFANSLSATITTADASVGASQYSMITQRIEGYNIADLNFGTANAKTVTISFWVQASVTGTYGGVINNENSVRSYPFTYTISAANTWEQKSITIAGDTSGTWLKTNGVGFQVRWALGMGSSLAGTAGSWSTNTYFGATGGTNLISTAGATFYITGVQLEVGSTATSFDYRPYGTELALCQRYCQVISIRDNGFVGFNNSTTVGWFGYYPPVVMRTLPTLGTTGTASNYRILYAGGATACSVIPSMVSDQGTGFYRIEGTVASGLTSGQGSMLIGNNAAYNISFLAEL